MLSRRERTPTPKAIPRPTPRTAQMRLAAVSRRTYFHAGILRIPARGGTRVLRPGINFEVRIVAVLRERKSFSVRPTQESGFRESLQNRYRVRRPLRRPK